MHKWWNWSYQIWEESENPSLQIEVNRVLRESNEKKTQQILQQLQFKEKNGIFIIEMHFVGLFIVLMITQK